MAPKSTSIIAAAKDFDLRERAIALASDIGIQSAHSWVDQNLFQLASTPVDSTGENTVASVFEYALAQYEAKKADLIEPGKDLSIVTDAHLRFALQALKDADSSAGATGVA